MRLWIQVQREAALLALFFALLAERVSSQDPSTTLDPSFGGENGFEVATTTRLARCYTFQCPSGKVLKDWGYHRRCQSTACSMNDVDVCCKSKWWGGWQWLNLVLWICCCCSFCCGGAHFCYLFRKQYIRRDKIYLAERKKKQGLQRDVSYEELEQENAYLRSSLGLPPKEVVQKNRDIEENPDNAFLTESDSE